MDVANRCCLRERVQVTVVLEVLFGVRKPFAANFRLAETVAADGCAHGTVQDDDPFAQQTFQLRGATWWLAQISTHSRR